MKMVCLECVRIYLEVRVAIVNGQLVSFCAVTDWLFIVCKIS